MRFWEAYWMEGEIPEGGCWEVATAEGVTRAAENWEVESREVENWEVDLQKDRHHL